MRLGEALTRIRNGAGVTDVASGHGYESDSGFRHSFNKVFGKSPGQSRGADCVLFRLIDSPVGPLLAGATSAAACFLEFTDRRALETQVDRLRGHLKLPIVPGDNEPLRLLDEELRHYFDRRLREFTVPIHYPGTDFQRQVWTQLRRIPYGETISYAVLASRVKRPGASRAVGRANGQNRLAIVIPCHRVVNKNGQLGGYGGGLWRKQFLLDLEQGTLLP
jgi:AraC family transcriptional regulator of adaptative response/methylated-DNA-[protein]-cysteine methyltransferase